MLTFGSLFFFLFFFFSHGDNSLKVRPNCPLPFSFEIAYAIFYELIQHIAIGHAWFTQDNAISTTELLVFAHAQLS